MSTVKRKKQNMYIILVILVCFIGIAFAMLSKKFNITGTAVISEKSWSVYFDNIVMNPDSIEPQEEGRVIIDRDDKTLLRYNVFLQNPGDFYEFTVDIVNGGTIDAMIESIELTPELTEAQAKYIDFDIRYDNGARLKEKDLLPQSTTQKIRIKSSYKRNISLEEFQQISSANVGNVQFAVQLNYIQSDNTAKEIETPTFETADWKEVSNLIRKNIISLGNEKEIELTGFGTHKVRIANTTTPDECKDASFSQTACGIVIEFIDVITTSNMNDEDTNVGGYPESLLYERLQSTIYNSLPNDLKEIIIPTAVISGHGSEENENFESVDKLYLLSPTEIYESISGEQYDKAITQTRQLDNYAKLTSAQIATTATKKFQNSKKAWWLRTSRGPNNYTFFVIGPDGEIDGRHANTVYGISPTFRIA